MRRRRSPVFCGGVNGAGFGGTESMTAIPLTSNTLYYVVTTGFNATDAGPYVLDFSGPSSVTQVFIPLSAGRLHARRQGGCE